MYCTQCGTHNYEGCENCTQCNHPIGSISLPAGVAELPQQFLGLVGALIQMGGASIVQLLDKLWDKADEADKESVIEAIIERILDLIPKGTADKELAALLKKFAGSEGAERYFSEDTWARRTLERAITVHFARCITKKRESTRDFPDVITLLTEASLLTGVQEISKEMAEKQRGSIENLIRDRMATEMPRIVEEAVKEMAQEALANVKASKS